MYQLHLSPAAEQDLENILEYTLLNWGERKLDEYVEEIHKTFLKRWISKPIFRKNMTKMNGLFGSQLVVFIRILFQGKIPDSCSFNIKLFFIYK
jgi:plasmid stabilization system protein ParE